MSLHDAVNLLTISRCCDTHAGGKRQCSSQTSASVKRWTQEPRHGRALLPPTLLKVPMGHYPGRRLRSSKIERCLTALPCYETCHACHRRLWARVCCTRRVQESMSGRAVILLQADPYKADLYALGVVIWEICTRRFPFKVRLGLWRVEARTEPECLPLAG